MQSHGCISRQTEDPSCFSRERENPSWVGLSPPRLVTLFPMTNRKVDVRLPGKGDSNSHGARPVHLIITMIKWIWTSRLSIKNSLSHDQTGEVLSHETLWLANSRAVWVARVGGTPVVRAFAILSRLIFSSLFEPTNLANPGSFLR